MVFTLTTTEFYSEEAELIIIDKPPRKATSIRAAFMRQNESAYIRAVEKGAEAVRDYFNGFNLRRRQM